jgi:hypothetical protein
VPNIANRLFANAMTLNQGLGESLAE